MDAIFRYFNEGKAYADQVKPANFLLTGHIAALDRPVGTDASRFRLVRPFELSPGKRTDRWTNIYDGSRYTARSPESEPYAHRVLLSSYRDVVSQYRRHPESKSGDADGNPSSEDTGGLLSRLHVVAVGKPRYIGKESNQLEDVEAGIVGDADSVYVTYLDREAELSLLRSILSTLPRKAVGQRAGISPRSLQRIVHAGVVPHPKTRKALIQAASSEIAERLSAVGIIVPLDAPFEMLAAMWLDSPLSNDHGRMTR